MKTYHPEFIHGGDVFESVSIIHTAFHKQV